VEIVNMTTHSFQKDLSLLEKHYSRLFEIHGDTPQAVQQRNRKTQEKRMAILTEVGDLTSAKVLDSGCGTGHLLKFMRDRKGFLGEYVGYDFSGRMITAAQAKFPDARFERRDILEKGIPEEFEYVLISGVFNNRISDNWGLMKAILRCLFSYTRKAIAFNVLSTYVDFFDPRLFYFSPEKVLQHCKEELSPCVTLRHDYLIKAGVVPFEFTVYVYRSEIEPRKELSTT